MFELLNEQRKERNVKIGNANRSINQEHEQCSKKLQGFGSKFDCAKYWQVGSYRMAVLFFILFFWFGFRWYFEIKKNFAKFIDIIASFRKFHISFDWTKV